MIIKWIKFCVSVKTKKKIPQIEIKKAERGTGEVAQQLGVCTVPSIHISWLTTTCNSSSPCPVTCSGLYRNLHPSSCAHVHIYHTHNLKWKNKKRIRTQINTLKCTSIVWKEKKNSKE